MALPPLPDGLTARPVTLDDLDALVEMLNDTERHDTGELMWERADLLSDSATEGFDRERDWALVHEGERIVGWALIVHLRSAWVDVHPDARGRGLGTWLRRWTEERGREKGSPRVGQTIDDALADTVALLRAAGYTGRHTSWILRIDHAEPPVPPSPPPGVELRAFRPGDEVPALEMFEAAFAEWPDRLPSTLETWRAMTIDREGFTPEDLMLAVEDGRVVGGAFLLDADEIWVDKLAVAADARHRGIARALLHVAFQRSYDRGYRWTRVSTDSKTGALSLYERVGMRVERSFTHWAIDL